MGDGLWKRPQSTTGTGEWRGRDYIYRGVTGTAAGHQKTMACPTFTLLRCGGLVWILRGLDVALEEVLVILFARIFHDLPVGPQCERPDVLPRLGIHQDRKSVV